MVTNGFDLSRYRREKEGPESQHEVRPYPVYESNYAKVIKVDAYGQIKKERSMLGVVFAALFNRESLTQDEFSPIWIPVERLEAGGEGFGGSISGQIQWRDWNVYVVKAKKFSSETYYDSETGYVVGMISGVGGQAEMVLVDTNAELPVAEGF